MKKLSLRGIATIEILIAFTFMVIILSGAVLLAFGGQTSGLDVELANHGLYRVLSQNESNIAAAAGSWGSLVNSSVSAGGYTTSLDVMSISACMKFATTSISWASENNRIGNSSLVSLFANITEARALGGSCSPLPPPQWENPDTFASETVSAIRANDVAVGSIDGKRIAVLVSTAGAGAESKHDIWVFDLSDIQNPSLLTSTSTGVGLNAVALSGLYAYAVQNDSTEQLQVIKLIDTAKAVTDPLRWNARLVDSVNLKNVGGVYPEGRSIAFYDNRLYVGTWNNNVPVNSPEFLIYDVSSPDSLVFLGSYNLGHSVNAIAVSSAYAYLATTNNAGELTIMNVSDPGSPTVASTFHFLGSSKDAESIALVGTTAYLGLTKATASGDLDFLAINVSNPFSPTLYMGGPSGLKLNMNGAGAAATNIVIQGPYAFVGTSDTNDEFRVLLISNPAKPVPQGCPPYNYSAKVSGLAYVDGLVVASNSTNDSLRVIYDAPGTQCH